MHAREPAPGAVSGAPQRPQPSDPEPRLVRTSVGEVAVAEEGTAGGRPLLCIHGVPGSSRDFRYLGPLLARSFRVLRLEMPGFGRSPRGRDASVEGWSRVALAVADALGLGRVVLLSHSFGSVAALRAAAHAPARVRGLVLLAPLGPRVHRGFGVPPVVFRFYAGMLSWPPSRGWAWAAGQRAYAARKSQAPADWQELRHHLRVISTVDFAKVGALARATPAPALVFHAADDRLIEIEIARELAAMLPRADLRELADGGHHIQKTRAVEIAADVESRFAS